MSRDKKLIYFLVSLIVFLSVVLLIKIKSTPKYNPKIFADIYEEYNDIFGNNSDIQTSDRNNTYTTKSNTKKGNVIGKMVIPEIEIECPIIKETTEEYLKIAPTKYFGPEVNEIGNLVIVGHNYKDGRCFGNLKKISEGDNIFLLSSGGNAKMYTVYDKYIINEKDMSCISQDTEGKIELTLITCDKDNSKRLVVKCKVSN